MQILLCAATSLEIQPLLQGLQDRHRHMVQVLVTGVGMTAATYALTRAVVSQRPGMILQAGIAGYLDPSLTPGMVVAVGKEYLGDLGVEEHQGFRSVFDLSLAGPDDFPFTGGALVNDGPVLADAGLPVVDGITVNEISTSEQRIGFYREKYHASVESMEGAALHYVALSEKIPFLQVRSLSNFIGERNKGNWHMETALKNLNETVLQLIQKLNP
ncbi:MAG TPA: futalosine hydrolase [Flavisolibacter sp.]